MPRSMNVLWLDASSNFVTANMRQPLLQPAFFSARVADCQGHLWGASAGLCNMMFGQKVETNHLQRWKELFYSTHTMYAGSSKAGDEVGVFESMKWQITAAIVPKKLRDAHGFSPFTGAMLVNYCYGRGYENVCGTRDTSLAQLQHPALLVVSPSSVSSASTVYKWLDLVLPALPYYLVKSATEIACHLHGSDTCVAVFVNDCSVQVLQVLRGRDDPDSIAVMQFADSLMTFPCPQLEEERGRTTAALAERLRDSAVVEFIRHHTERLASRLPGVKLCAAGLLSAGVLDSLVAAVAPRVLAPPPQGVDPANLMSTAVLTFLASPNCAAEFVPCKDLHKKANESTGKIARKALSNDLSRSPLTISKIGEPPGFLRARVVQWDELCDIPNVLRESCQLVGAEVPPVLGTALAYAMGVNGPIVPRVFVELLRKHEEANLVHVAGALAAASMVRKDAAKRVLVLFEKVDHKNDGVLLNVLRGELGADAVCATEAEWGPAHRVLLRSPERWSPFPAKLAPLPAGPWGGAVALFAENPWSNSSSDCHSLIADICNAMPALFCIGSRLNGPFKLPREVTEAVVIRA